jgi:ethanolamine utilization protein EutN
MFLGKVIGNVVSTRKDERLVGHKLLLVQLMNPEPGVSDFHPGGGTRDVLLSVDLIGAGMDEMVILCGGSSARAAAGDLGAPIDACIIGIVDSAVVGSREVRYA